MLIVNLNPLRMGAPWAYAISVVFRAEAKSQKRPVHMHQTRKTVSHWVGWRLTPAIPAIILAIGLALPSSSVMARNPANVVLNNTPTGLVVGGITVSPKNDSVYVAAYAPTSGLPSHLVVINAYFGTITADLPLTGQAEAVDVAISPDGRRVFVTNFVSGTVAIVATARNAVIGTLSVGPYPFGLAVSPDGKELWVANSGSTPLFNNGTVSVYDIATRKPIALINVGGSPTQVVFDKTGKVAFALNQHLPGFVSVIDAATREIKNANFAAGIVKNPLGFGEAILPGDTSLYVDNQFATINNLLVKNGTLKNVVTVFPTSVPPSLQGLGQPVITRDGKFLYVANPSLNQVSWATTENDLAQQLSPISVSPGSVPVTLAVSPDDTRLYVGNSGNGLVTQIDIAH